MSDWNRTRTTVTPWRGHVGEILAQWEDAANTAAIDHNANAEELAMTLLRDEFQVPECTTEEGRAELVRTEWQAVENGRSLRDAWRAISNGLRRVLRVMKVETWSKRRADKEAVRVLAEAKARKRSYYA